MLYEKIREMNELGKLEVFNNYLLHVGKDIIYAKSKSTFENNGWYCVLDADGFEKYLVYHYDTGKKICVRFVDGKTPQIQEADPTFPWFGEMIDVFSVLSFASDSQGNVIDIVQNALDDEAIKVNHLNTEEGDAVKLVGYDSEGNLVEDTIPEGIVVDDALNTESDNAIANAPVATAIAGLESDISDIETALDTKANTADLENGTLVVSKALTAEEIAPVSEESGTIQDDPFISQGTGTENNTGSTDTSPVGKQLEKQGNTLAVNQLAPSNTIASNTSNGITCTQNGDGTYTLSGTAEAEANFVGTQLTLPVGHKLLISGGKSESVVVGITNHGNTSGSRILTITQNGSLYISVANGTDLTTPITLFPIIADLTQDFNGDIPQDLLDHPDHLSWYYNGSLAYNAGTLKNSDGRYLVCTGRQLWDEVTELGSISDANGQNASGSSNIRSKNYIMVIPNRTYYAKGYVKVYCYDANKNYIGVLGWKYNTTFVVPADCRFIRFFVDNSYGTTYNHDITISLYYSPEQGGEGYDQYYPYQEPKVYDTGTEELLRIPVVSGDDVLDSKLPNGTITRKCANETFTLTYDSEANVFSTSTQVAGASRGAKFICDKGYANSGSTSVASMPDKSLQIVNAGGIGIWVKDSSLSTSETLTIDLTYELATPTTEQGTTFSENIEIDDYGMMYWLDADGNLVEVPQGVKLFYPAWYVGFIDSLYARTSGDATDVVVQSELTAVNNRINTLLETGKKYKIVACVLRNNNGTWEQIGGGDHAPINVTSITQDSNFINVNFSFTAKNVVSFVACPDEEFAKLGYDIGSSVGITQARIQIFQNRVLSGFLQYTKSTGDFNRYDDISSASINTTTGLITINHGNIGSQFGRSYGVRYGKYIVAFDSLGATTDTFKLFDYSGNAVVDPDDFQLTWSAFATGGIAPSQANQQGNIWCLGIFEID